MRLFLFAAAALLAAPSASAQLPSISVGIAGGPNFSSFNDVAGAELDGTTGYHVGLYGDVSIPLVAFRTGIYYLSAGNVQTAGTDESLVDANFVTVPVDFRFQTPTPIVKAYVLAGPEFRFPIGDRADGAADGPVIDRTDVNVALNVGVGAAFKAPLVGPSAFLELRYSQDVSGFAKLADSGIGGNSGTFSDDYKVSLFQVRLGVGL